MHIDRLGALLIHQKDDATTGFGQGRPVAGMHGLNQRWSISAHFVRSNDFARLEDRSNLSVQCVEERRRKRFCLYRVRQLVRRILLRLH